MENPYRSPDDHDLAREPQRVAVPVLLFGAAILGLIVVNYSTATRLPTNSPTSFGHVVFCMMPFSCVAFWCVLSDQPTVWVVYGSYSLVAIVVSLAFCLAFFPQVLLRNDYLGFVSSRYFFGPYGVFPLMWFACCQHCWPCSQHCVRSQHSVYYHSSFSLHIYRTFG